jgi:hypothetical protein
MNTNIIDLNKHSLTLNWVVYEELGYWYDLSNGTRTDLRTGEKTKDWDRSELFDNLRKTK